MRMYSSGTIRYNNTDYITTPDRDWSGRDTLRSCLLRRTIISGCYSRKKSDRAPRDGVFYRSPIILFYQFFPQVLHRVLSGSFAVVRLYNTRFSGRSRGPHLCNARVRPRLEKTADIRDPVFVCVCAHVSSAIVFATVNRIYGPF